MIAYTGGTFDLFHPGHVELLRQCRAFVGRDGKVVVSLNTDEFVQQYKGLTPTYGFEARRAILEACEYVDLVVKNTGGPDSKPAIEVVMPDVILIGEDWRKKDYCAQMGFTEAWLIERNIRVHYIRHLPGYSSTNTRRQLAGVK